MRAALEKIRMDLQWQLQQHMDAFYELDIVIALAHQRVARASLKTFRRWLELRAQHDDAIQILIIALSQCHPELNAQEAK